MPEKPKRRFFEKLEERYLLTNDLIDLTGEASTRRGDIYSLELQAIAPPNAPSIDEWIVDWGDGRQSTFETLPETVLHRYLDTSEQYLVSIDAIDSEGNVLNNSDEILVQVQPAAPELVDRSQEGFATSIWRTGSFSGSPDLQKIDPTIDFEFGSGSPDSLLDYDDEFAIRWTAQLTAQFAARHTFEASVGAGDSLRISVAGQTYVDTFGDPTADLQSFDIDLAPASPVEVVVDYLAGIGPSSITLDWENPYWFKEPIPANHLVPVGHSTTNGMSLDQWEIPAGNDLNALYSLVDYEMNVPSQSSLVNEAFLDYFAPEGQAAGQRFGNRLRTIVTAPTTGEYLFHLAASGVAELRINTHLDSANLTLMAGSNDALYQDFTSSPNQSSETVFLQQGQRVYVELLQVENEVGDNHASVAWTLPNQTEIQLIPSQALEPIKPEVTIFSEASVSNETSGYAQGLSSSFALFR